MKNNELIKLRFLVGEEIKRRKRIKELIRKDLVKEYLDKTNTNPEVLDENNIHEIIDKVLSTFTITKTNGIYVCTSAYYLECNICYEETSYDTVDVDIDSKYAEYKLYTDIENGKTEYAVRKPENGSYYKNLITDFEKDNIILNPYNSRRNKNGLDEVRYDFFETAISEGQAKSKRKILSKYPRLT